jgi:adenylate kinase family enzyme
VRRVVVIGSSGAGKTTLARRIARHLDVANLELDAVFHQSNWTRLPREEFRARVSDLVTADGWVIDGNYSEVQDIVWPRADTVVWVDLPRWLVTSRIVRRTVIRGVRRQELWNGNRENLINVLRRDREFNIVLWSWTHFRPYRERFTAAMADPAHAHLKFIRLRTRAEVAAFPTRSD